MNSSEILLEGKKPVAAIGKQLFEALKKVADAKAIEISAGEPIVDKSPRENRVFGLLRFGTSKIHAVYALGADEASWKIWEEKFAAHSVTPSDPDAPPAKPLEFELMKAVYIGLDPELKAQGIAVDPKSLGIQDRSNLGEWNRLKTEGSVKFPFTTSAGEMVLEIPLFSVEWARQFTLDAYGFRANIRVLVVDDSPVARKQSRNCLAMAGYFNVDECADGQAGYNKVVGSSPAIDLVIADWHMPVMTGFEMLKQIRAVPELKKLAVIMVTGEKNKDEVVSAVKAGATGYLVKPVVPEQFLKSLRKAGGRG